MFYHAGQSYNHVDKFPSITCTVMMLGAGFVPVHADDIADQLSDLMATLDGLLKRAEISAPHLLLAI